MPAPITIGVFDSGFGGLTVLRALLPRIPGAHYIYLGDTARLPYGAKSQATIARYAVESAHFLESRGCQFLVIACNTATALALDDIRRSVAIPVLGVVEPGAQAAHRALTKMEAADANSNTLSSRPESSQLYREDAVERPAVPSTTPQVLVLATAATVQSHAYHRACAALGLHATEVACPLLVPLVEEGWINHPVTRDILRIYLTEALLTEALQQISPQAVLLGCTHYPLLAAEIEATLRSLGSQAIVIDSAEATASAAAQEIASLTLSSRQTTNQPPANSTAPATFECFATDSVEKFRRLGSLFLGHPIPAVHHLDLGG